MSNILDKIQLSGTTYDLIDSTAIHSLDGYYTSAQTQSAITAATNALAESIAEQGYQTSGDVQSAISGKTDTSAFTAYTAATEETLADKAEKSEIPSVSGYADSVKYNSTSKYVEFYHGGTGGTKVFEYDASPFLIDGMVQNVEIKDVYASSETVDFGTGKTFTFTGTPQNFVIKVKDSWWTADNFRKTHLEFSPGDSEFAQDSGSVYVSRGTVTNTGNTFNLTLNSTASSVSYVNDEAPTHYDSIEAVYGSPVTCLVISFNTDAGKQDINIPISDIFNANNYYTKTEVDNAITAATDGKADTSAVTAVNDVLTAHTADTTIHVTSSDKTTWSGKQDALVSGTNIKTINGNSILGSGDITVQTLPTVQGTTLVFS